MDFKDKMDAATHDLEHKDWSVKSVRETEDDTCVVDFDEGSSLIVRSEHGLRLPEPGDTLRLFGRGFGYVVRGIGLVERSPILPARSLKDAVLQPGPAERERRGLERIKLVGLYRYQTAAEEKASHLASVEESNKKKQAEWAEKAAETAKRVAEMPEPFRARFEFFMRRPDWGWNFGPYELFCCEEAIKITSSLVTADAIATFARMTVSERKERVPGLAYDEHSGNTFGAACKFAHCYVAEPELVPKMHGALCPLVGCASYGCWSTVASGAISP